MVVFLLGVDWMSERIVKAHDQVRRLLEVVHYPDHEPRHESTEFREAKRKLLEKGAKCYINNGFCAGPLQFHHAIIEWAAANAVDWEKVRRDYGFDHPDDVKNLVPLCAKHHTAVGTGIHSISFPAWILQKYLDKRNLELFEQAVKHLKEAGHEDHQVNHAAKKLLLHLHKKKGDAANAGQQSGHHFSA